MTAKCGLLGVAGWTMRWWENWVKAKGKGARTSLGRGESSRPRRQRGQRSRVDASLHLPLGYAGSLLLRRGVLGLGGSSLGRGHILQIALNLLGVAVLFGAESQPRREEAMD